VVQEIEQMELLDENIWVPIGILEVMYDDIFGDIDNYFHLPKEQRNLKELLKQLDLS
jgi:hypothetical protein